MVLPTFPFGMESIICFSVSIGSGSGLMGTSGGGTGAEGLATVVAADGGELSGGAVGFSAGDDLATGSRGSITAELGCSAGDGAGSGRFGDGGTGWLISGPGSGVAGGVAPGVVAGGGAI